MPLQFRPFGVLGSMLEVIVGLLALRSGPFADEDDPVWFTTAGVVIGTILISAGVTGLVVAARRALTARSSRKARSASQGD
jgi:hypothetical protein